MTLAEEGSTVSARSSISERLTPREALLHREGVYYSRHTDGIGRAIDAYKKAIELYPDHASARHNLAGIYDDLERDQKSIPQYEELATARDDVSIDARQPGGRMRQDRQLRERAHRSTAGISTQQSRGGVGRRTSPPTWPRGAKSWRKRRLRTTGAKPSHRVVRSWPWAASISPCWVSGGPMSRPHLRTLRQVLRFVHKMAGQDRRRERCVPQRTAG